MSTQSNFFVLTPECRDIVLTIDTTTNVFIALRWCSEMMVLRNDYVCSEMIMCFAYEHTHMYKDSDMHKDSDCIASGMQDKWGGPE